MGITKVIYWDAVMKSYGLHGYFRSSKKKKIWVILSAFFILGVISGCASIPIPGIKPVPVDRFQAYEMPDGTKIYPASVDKTIPDVDILAINNDIKSLLDEKVVKIKNPQKRLTTLTNILTSKISYDTVNDAYGVKTAQETFDTGTGNCLSFSNLFIAVSRYAGMKSRFAEIPIVPNWTRAGEMLFFTMHIGVSVDIRDRNTNVIQLKITDKASRIVQIDTSLRYYFYPSALKPDESTAGTFSLHPIPDNRAFAQHYNNIGSKKLAEGNNRDAFRYFVKAIKTDPRLSFAWSNLGVVYRRNGQFDAAEAAYYQGLLVTHGFKDTSMLTIMNNLANLYDVTGNAGKAAFFKDRVASFREKNPYYQYAEGKKAYDESSYEKSVAFFKKAIRLKKDEHLFYYSLALAYSKTGDLKKAEASIKQAIEYSQDKRQKEYYEKVRDEIKK